MTERPIMRLAGAAILALSMPALAQDDVADPGAVLARVGDTEITLGHMIALRERLPAQYDQVAPETLFSGLLDQLVNQAALAQTVEDTPRSVELALENERRALLANEALSDAMEGAVTDEAIQAAYEEAYADIGSQPEYNASHILVETEDEARQIVDELEGGADFAQLAQERSTGPSGPGGGALGWFGPGMMVPAFEAAVASLEPGEISGPVQTQFGWHVVRLNDQRQQEAPPLGEVRGELSEAVQSQAVQDAIRRATDSATVERTDVSGINPAVLNRQDLIEPE